MEYSMSPGFEMHRSTRSKRSEAGTTDCAFPSLLSQRLTASAIPPLAACLPLTRRARLMLFISYCSFCNLPYFLSTKVTGNKVVRYAILNVIVPSKKWHNQIF